MNRAAFRYRSYRWHGGDEWLAEIGEGPPVLIVPPLLEELNRCRKFLADVMRGLAGAGFHAVLPDLPGTGESPRDLATTGWEDWTGALGLLSFDLKARSQAAVLVSFRGGCLLEEQADVAGHWRFAPAAGATLVRDLIRARQAASSQKTRGDAIDREARASATEFAGYLLPPALFRQIADAQPFDAAGARVVRLKNDPAEADLKINGKPLWRQAEPGSDAELSARLASDIAEWARTCGG